MQKLVYFWWMFMNCAIHLWKLIDYNHFVSTNISAWWRYLWIQYSHIGTSCTLIFIHIRNHWINNSSHDVVINGRKTKKFCLLPVVGILVIETSVEVFIQGLRCGNKDYYIRYTKGPSISRYTSCDNMKIKLIFLFLYFPKFRFILNLWITKLKCWFSQMKLLNYHLSKCFNHLVTIFARNMETNNRILLLFDRL